MVGGERVAQPTADGRSGVFGSMRRPGRAAGAPCGRGMALGFQSRLGSSGKKNGVDILAGELSTFGFGGEG